MILNSFLLKIFDAYRDIPSFALCVLFDLGFGYLSAKLLLAIGVKNKLWAGIGSFIVMVITFFGWIIFNILVIEPMGYTVRWGGVSGVIAGIYCYRVIVKSLIKDGIIKEENSEHEINKESIDEAINEESTEETFNDNVCPACHHENKLVDEFCNECGLRLK